MINVGIAGALPAINRHTYVLNRIHDVRVTGRWITSESGDTAFNMESGITSSDPGTITGRAEVMIIADKSSLSARLATYALKKAKHILVYPSVISSVNEVNALIKLAREANVILKCGRTGNSGYNGLVKAISDKGPVNLIDFHHSIKLLQGDRQNLLFNQLLADIEIMNSLIRARNTSIRVKGHSLLTSRPEVINARLEFDNGCAVNYYCNLLALQNDHHITIVLKDCLLKYDFIAYELSRWYLKPALIQNENPIFIEKIQVEQGDNLYDDLMTFFNLIRSGPAFLSIYDNGFEPLVMADRIHERVLKTLVQFA